MTPARRDRINKVLGRRQPDLTVITDAIVKERNLAAVIRTCDAVGVPKVHCVVPEEGYRSYRGTSASAHKWVETVHHDSTMAAIAQCQTDGMQVVAATLSSQAVDYRELDYCRPTAVLMGTEVFGVSEEAAEAADAHIVIPMMGMVESFNVSVACAIILAEAQGQRMRQGLYEQSRMDAEEYRRLFFKWAYPDLASYCDARDLPYPPLDEHGDLIPGTAPGQGRE